MKKGFTLIEVISVIVILGIIGLIAVPIANNITKSSKDKLYKEQVDRIKEAAKNYVLENDEYVPNETEGNIETIDVQKLINEGYLSDDEIINPKDNKKMDGVITITYTENEYVYHYVEYIYYAKAGDGLTSIDDKNALKNRPTNYLTYVRYPIEDGQLGLPEACFLYQEKDFCLSNKYGYEENRKRVLEYFGYDNSWTALAPHEFNDGSLRITKQNPTNSELHCNFFYYSRSNMLETGMNCGYEGRLSADVGGTVGCHNGFQNGRCKNDEDAYLFKSISVTTRQNNKIACNVDTVGQVKCVG